MPNRISRVTTKTGDAGNTRLAATALIDKGIDILELVGALDEANSSLGVLVQYVDSVYVDELKTIQSRLFDIGATLATDEIQPYWLEQTQSLSTMTKELNSQLAPLKEFVIPGGGKAAAFAHVARTTIRRTERLFWRVANEKLRESGIGAYLNRLSDYLFVLSRAVADAEEVWRPLRK